MRDGQRGAERLGDGGPLILVALESSAILQESVHGGVEVGGVDGWPAVWGAERERLG